MFCQKCGAQIKDTAKFCSSCGAQVAVIPQPAPQPQNQIPVYPPENAPVYYNNGAGYPYGGVPSYPPQQSVYVVRQIDPERNTKIFKMVMAIVYGVLSAILFCLTFFAEIFGDSSSSIVQLIGDEYFVEYSYRVDTLFFMAIFFFLGSIFLDLAFTGIPRYGDLTLGWIYAGSASYLIGFLICACGEDWEVGGLLIFNMVLLIITITVGEIQSKARPATMGKDNSGSSLAGAYPKHLTAQIPYSGKMPADGDFDDLINGSGLREHLLKTHPNNQLYLTVYQTAYNKFKEMAVSALDANRRVFDYTDSKNRIRFNLRYENHKFDCEIYVNM